MEFEDVWMFLSKLDLTSERYIQSWGSRRVCSRACLSMRVCVCVMRGKVCVECEELET